MKEKGSGCSVEMQGGDQRPRKSIRRVALVGLGSIGSRHLRLLKELRPECEVLLVRSGIGSSFPEEVLATKTVKNVQEALVEGIDAAIISTPAPFHLEALRLLVCAGIPTMVEKPLSHTIAGCQEIADLAEKSRVPVLMAYPFRHDPALTFAANEVKKGTIGLVLQASVVCGAHLQEWRPGRDYRQTVSAREELGGGVLLEISHEIDLVNWVLGPIREVQAYLHQTGTLEIDVEDMALLGVLAGDSIPTSMQLDFNRCFFKREFSIQGTKGELNWDGVESSVAIRKVGEPLQKETFNGGVDAKYRNQLKHFFLCAENGATPLVSLADGIRVLQVVEAARESHSTGKRMTL